MAELRGDLSLDTSNAESQIDALQSNFDAVVSQFQESLTNALDLPTPELDTSQIDAALTASGETGAEVIASGISEGATTGASEAEAALAGIDVPDLTLPVEADTATAEAELAAIDGPTVQVLADIGPAEDAISGISADPIDIPVEVDTSSAEESLSNLDASARGATEGVGGLHQATEGFDAAAELAVGSAAGLGAAAKGMGGEVALGAAVVGTTAGVLHEFFEEGIHATGAAQQFEAALGPMRSRVEELADVKGLNLDLHELASALGTNEASLAQVTARFFSLATASGLTRQEAAEYVQQLIAMSARAVALNPQLGTMDDVMARLAGGLARGGRFAANYSIALTSSEIATRALANTGKDSADQLTIVDKSLAGAQLAAEKYGDTLNTTVTTGADNAIIKQRSLKNAVTETIETLGQPLVTPIFDLMEASRPLIEQVGRLFVQLGQAAIPVVTAAVIALTPILKLLADALDSIAPLLPFILDAFLAWKVISFLPPLLGIIGASLVTVGEAAPIAGAGFVAVGAGADAAALGVEAFTVALAENPITLLVVGLTVAAAAFGIFGGGINQADQDLQSFNDSLVETGGKLDETSLKAARSLLEERHQMDDLTDAGVKFDAVVEATSVHSGETADALDKLSKASITLGGGTRGVSNALHDQIDAIRETNPELAALLTKLDRHGTLNLGLINTLKGLADSQHEAAVTTKERSDAGATDADIADKETGAVTGLGNATEDAAQQQADATKQAEDAWKSFVDSLVGALPTIQSSYENAFQGAQDSLDNFFANLGKEPPPIKIVPNAEQVAASLVSSLDSYRAYVFNVRALVAQGYDDLAQIAIQQGPIQGAATADMWVHAEQATKDAAEQTLEDTQQLTKDQEAWIRGEGAQRLASATNESAQHARDVFAFTYGVVVDDTGTIFDNVTGAVLGHEPSLANQSGATGGTAAGKFGEGFGQSTPIASAVLGDIGGVINQSQGPLGSDAHITGLAIGSQLGEGIYSGLHMWTTRVEDELREIIRLAKQAADAESQSHSPSKLFMEVGENISEGLAIGIANAGSLAVNAVESVVGGLAPAALAVPASGSTSSTVPTIRFDISVNGVTDEGVGRAVGTQIGDAAAAALARRGVIVSAKTS